jgi:hypothetical protein
LKRLTHVYFALFPSMPIAAPLDSSRTRWSPTPYCVNATTPANLEFAEEASEVDQEQSFGGALRESIGTGNTPVGKPYSVPGDVTCRGGATPASSIGKPRLGVFVSVLSRSWLPLNTQLQPRTGFSPSVMSDEPVEGLRENNPSGQADESGANFGEGGVAFSPAPAESQSQDGWAPEMASNQNIPDAIIVAANLASGGTAANQNGGLRISNSTGTCPLSGLLLTLRKSLTFSCHLNRNPTQPIGPPHTRRRG